MSSMSDLWMDELDPVVADATLDGPDASYPARGGVAEGPSVSYSMTTSSDDASGDGDAEKTTKSTTKKKKKKKKKKRMADGRKATRTYASSVAIGKGVRTGSGPIKLGGSGGGIGAGVGSVGGIGGVGGKRFASKTGQVLRHLSAPTNGNIILAEMSGANDDAVRAAGLDPDEEIACYFQLSWDKEKRVKKVMLPRAHQALRTAVDLCFYLETQFLLDRAIQVGVFEESSGLYVMLDDTNDSLLFNSVAGRLPGQTGPARMVKIMIYERNMFLFRHRRYTDSSYSSSSESTMHRDVPRGEIDDLIDKRGPEEQSANERVHSESKKERIRQHRRLFPMETKPNASAQPHPFMDAAYDITTVDYNADRYKVREYADVASLASSSPRDWATVRWVNVEGINDDVLRELQSLYDIHPLAIEDALTVPNLPKVTEFGGQVLAIVFAMCHNQMEDEVDFHDTILAKDIDIKSVQLSIIVVNPSLIITVQEGKYPVSIFNAIWRPVLNRLNVDRSRIRKSEASFLLYSILDAVVDNYFPITAFWGGRLETIEKEMLVATNENHLKRIQLITHEVKLLRQILWQSHDATMTLHATDSIGPVTKQYLTDVSDHLNFNLEVCKTYIALGQSLSDFYQNVQADRMNNIMGVLTAVSTILATGSFVCGTYGMNFEHWFPEIHWQYGYVYYWIVIFVTSVLQLIIFNRIGFI